ncbi:hypothetical protein [Phenylobacterium sp.]|uniref:hypothetical protein n=1 Tax=Phenylobacterium sp. TaxID=1871053 RepID=UPI002B72CF64|nr:hypothetical protein [Phenylobacterium sp.]HLZ74225.1 hypothetical protein [Phenylobacterium sp.]
MPRRVLQVVAVLIGLISVSAFAAGIINAPSRGRMPGEKVAGQAGGAALVATDATPLGADRIEGLAPRELTPEEKEKLEADKEAKEEADEAVKAAAATAPPGVSVPAAPSSPAAVASETPPAPPPDEAPH